MPRTCADCRDRLCSLRIALEAGWVVGPGREGKTAVQVMEECGLVCNYHRAERVLGRVR